MLVLASVEAPPEAGALGDLADDEGVADEDGDVGDQLDQDELGPEDVEAHVDGVPPHVRGGDDGGVGRGVVLGLHLEVLGQVVDQGEDHGG